MDGYVGRDMDRHRDRSDTPGNNYFVKCERERAFEFCLHSCQANSINLDNLIFLLQNGIIISPSCVLNSLPQIGTRH